MSRRSGGPFEGLRGVVVDRIKVLHRIVTDASEARLTELRAVAELEAQAFLVSPRAIGAEPNIQPLTMRQPASSR